MTLKKYGDAEQANVFHGREAQVVSTHMQRHGKAVSEFSKDEKAALSAELEAIQAEENNVNKASASEPEAVEQEEPETAREERGQVGRKPAAKKEDE